MHPLHIHFFPHLLRQPSPLERGTAKRGVCIIPTDVGANGKGLLLFILGYIPRHIVTPLSRGDALHATTL